MVPSNILQRVFHVGHAGATASAFALEINARQFLVTAKHVVEALHAPCPLEIFRNNTWEPLVINAIWLPPGGDDVAVLCHAAPLPTAGQVTVSDAPNFFLSERVFFLGFPFGLTTEVGTVNDGYPLPFVKTGIIASFHPRSPSGSQLIFLDGHNNPGFSGGPVVTVSQSGEVVVVGVISAYRATNTPILLNGHPTGLTHQTNTGLVVSYGIVEAFGFMSTSTAGVALV